MRYIAINEDFYACEKQELGAFFIPFGVVESNDPTDNYLHFQFYGNDYTIDGIAVYNYETRSLLSVQPANYIHSGAVVIDGVMTNVFMVQVIVSEITCSCFFLKIGINPFPDTAFFKTEVFKIFRFNECDDNLIRLESHYPAFDCLMQDSELPGLSFVPISVKPNTYATFQDGAVFRNFQWFYGQLAWSESKFTKTYEGFFNTHTKTAVLENYDVFLRKMPDWYAKELSNVLGGTSLSVWTTTG